VLLDWADPLPGFVQERLERGIPATAGFRAELWKDRPGWFDAHLASTGLEYKILLDPWKEGFTLLNEESAVEVDSMSSLLEFLRRQRVKLPLLREWCDGSSGYRIVLTTYVRPLTAKDVKEVDAWLRGEIRGFGEGLFGLPRGLFGIVRDLSGLGERTNQGRSAGFRLSVLESGRVRALIPGGTGSSEANLP